MLTIDVRWMDLAGIGTYLAHVVPGILATFTDDPICLLGNTARLANLPGVDNSNVRILDVHSPMYSIREQFEIIQTIPKETKLFFATHYNIPLLYRGRMLVTVYDVMHLARYDLVGGLHKWLYAAMMLNATRWRAESILTISNFSKDELERLTFAGRADIHPIHLGVSDDWLTIPTQPRPYEGRYILYVGNVKPHKNLSALVRAYTTLAHRIPHDLVIVGRKEGFITGDDTVVRTTATMGDRIVFTGRVDDATLKQYFVHADIFVFPSLYEGFGLPPIEAMAAGCPTLVSNAASLPEICGDASLYCDPGNPTDIAEKLQTILDDPELQSLLRTRGRERIKTFRWETCVRKTCAVIARLLHGSHPVSH